MGPDPHHVLTGQKQPGGFFDKVASRDDWPCYSSGLSFLRRRDDGLPSGINLPTFLREGPLTWPGQHAGFLGQNFDPWQITGDPNKPDFRVDALTMAQGMDVVHLGKRQALLEEIKGTADTAKTEHYVRVYINTLRKKLVQHGLL